MFANDFKFSNILWRSFRIKRPKGSIEKKNSFIEQGTFELQNSLIDFEETIFSQLDNFVDD